MKKFPKKLPIDNEVATIYNKYRTIPIMSKEKITNGGLDSLALLLLEHDGFIHISWR
jgi:hypothetical protein